MGTRRRLFIVVVFLVVLEAFAIVFFVVPVVPYSHHYPGGYITGGIYTPPFTFVGSKSIGSAVFGYGGYTVNGTYHFDDFFES